MIIARFEPFALKVLDEKDAGALKMLEPGDLSISRGEWLFAPGNEKEFIEKAAQEYADGTSIWAAILKGEILVGVVALREINQSSKSAGLAYALGAPYRGQGIMTVACRQLISHGFNGLGLDNILIRADVANQRSSALAERLGFKKESIILNCYQSSDGYRDAVQYSLSRRDKLKQERPA